MNAPRAHVTGVGADAFVRADEQAHIPSHIIAIPVLGDTLVHHATACTIAEIELNESAPRISLIVAMPGCGCGCGAPGRGLLLTPAAAEARIIGEQLVKLAEDHEAAAGKAAADIIQKAAGR